jgi:hypothetical protein
MEVGENPTQNPSTALNDPEIEKQLVQQSNELQVL